jgi:ubiquinone/menaquinone biosynthesis C-methylase UbiE
MTANPWYVDAFTADYLEAYPHRDQLGAVREVKAVLGFLNFHREHDRLLDLAAGAGRHSLAMRAERCHVTCLDLSRDLTERSRAAGLPTVRADMRVLPFRDWAFDSVSMLFSSFGYFDSDAEHQQTLDEIARVLCPGGGVFLDLMDPQTVSDRLVPQGVDMQGETVIEVQRSMTPDGLRVEKTIRMMRPGAPERSWRESVRLFSGDEIETMASRARLEVAGTWGDYDGRAYAAGETRRLVMLRKPR